MPITSDGGRVPDFPPETYFFGTVRHAEQAKMHALNAAESSRMAGTRLNIIIGHQRLIKRVVITNITLTIILMLAVSASIADLLTS